MHISASGEDFIRRASMRVVWCSCGKFMGLTPATISQMRCLYSLKYDLSTMGMFGGGDEPCLGLSGWFSGGEIKEESSEVGAEILDRVECGF